MNRTLGQCIHSRHGLTVFFLRPKRMRQTVDNEVKIGPAGLWNAQNKVTSFRLLTVTLGASPAVRGRGSALAQEPCPVFLGESCWGCTATFCADATAWHCGCMAGTGGGSADVIGVVPESYWPQSFVVVITIYLTTFTVRLQIRTHVILNFLQSYPVLLLGPSNSSFIPSVRKSKKSTNGYLHHIRNAR